MEEKVFRVFNIYFGFCLIQSHTENLDKKLTTQRSSSSEVNKIQIKL
jgi:hypothetical protein